MWPLFSSALVDGVCIHTQDGDWDLVNMQRLSKAVEDTAKNEQNNAADASRSSDVATAPSVETPVPTTAADAARVDGGSEETKSSEGDTEKTATEQNAPSAAATKWHRELCSLAEMGFENTARNISLLEKHVNESGNPGMERWVKLFFFFFFVTCRLLYSYSFVFVESYFFTGQGSVVGVLSTVRCDGCFQSAKTRGNTHGSTTSMGGTALFVGFGSTRAVGLIAGPHEEFDQALCSGMVRVSLAQGAEGARCSRQSCPAAGERACRSVFNHNCAINDCLQPVKLCFGARPWVLLLWQRWFSLSFVPCDALVLFI